jgi:hypothetical protein
MTGTPHRLAASVRRAREKREAPRVKAGAKAILVWRAMISMAVIAIGIWILAHFLNSGGGAKGTQLKARFPPVEFLYLDQPRSLSYLEELQGGAVNSEQESRSATNNLEAKLKLESAEAGSSRQEVEQLQRSITPTAASIFTELRAALERGKKIHTIDHPAEYSEILDLPEGQFVLFDTEELHRPLYLDPYLAVRQDPTLTALFPMPEHGRRKRHRLRSERRASRLFAKQLGGSPHMVFSLWPGSAKKNVHYLLPLNIGSFNKEDSVLKNGGGSLTVLGKLTRVLPEPSEQEREERALNYVDFATRETWRLPLHFAPALLVCRSDPSCRANRRQEGAHGPGLVKDVRRARRAMEAALAAQTEVADKGAVIVPVAIYK